MAEKMTAVGWEQSSRTHVPERTECQGDELLVGAVEESDAWPTTSYGFVNADEHALVASLASEMAVEVGFVAAFSQQFDQAGIFLRTVGTAGERCWVKAGVEFADGCP